jgi:hypothetical protein
MIQNPLQDIDKDGGTQLPVATINRIGPRRFKAEIKFRLKRTPVVDTIGVLS